MLSCCKEKKCRAKINTEPTPDEAIVKLSSIVYDAPSADFSLGENLQFVYPLLDLVFAYLSYKDLLSASEVCQTWRETALKYLKLRQKVAWFSVSGRNKLHYELKRSKNIFLSDTHFCFVLIKPRMVALTSNICVEHLNHHTCCKVSEYLQKHITGHPFRQTIVLASNNILSHVDVTEKAERLTDDCSAILGLTIPDIPKTRIIFIQPNRTDDKHLRERYIKSSETVSSLLVFCSFNQKTNVTAFVQNLLKGQEPQEVGIAGGIFTGTKKYFIGTELCTVGSQNGCDVHCIAFLQSKYEESSLLSHSLVVRNGYTLEDFEQELMRFKEEITIRSQSVAFRFSCAAKELKRQDEIFAFNSVFPNTPVLGLDVHGEIGWDTTGKFEGITKNKRIKRSQLPCLFHEWVTTFLLITWDI